MAVACAGEPDEVLHDGRWMFTGEALARSRAVAHEKAERTLRSSSFVRVVAAAATAAGADLAADGIHPISLEDNERLVLFFARLLPELCSLASAPTEVCWTAIVFYRRFFAVRSAMEFDAAVVMFACVHIACKIEEHHEISLDSLLEAAELAHDGTMKAKVHSLELSVLEGIGFELLIEPKPDSALAMLVGELQDRAPSAFVEDEFASDALLRRAEKLAVELAVRTDAVLLWPASVITAAALGEAIDGPLRSRPPALGLLVAELNSLLLAGVQDRSQQLELQQLIECVRVHLRQVATAVDQDGGGQPQQDAETQEAIRLARRCNRVFDRLREEARERHETHRLERKRRWSVMKGGYPPFGRAVATPILQGLAEISRQAAALDVDCSDDWLCRGRVDMEDEC